MNRLAIYAAFDKNEEVDDADFFYIKAMKSSVEKIIYVCDNSLKSGEREKLDSLCDVIIAKRHGEYDFGSYKRGFNYAKEHNLLDKVDELIFCNDSCYAPFASFENVFASMSNKDYDFWGIAKNIEIDLHVQSYFLVFKPEVFNSKIFIDFINNITKQPTVNEVILKYEIGLSQTLLKAGFRAGSFIHPDKVKRKHRRFHTCNLTVYPIWFIRHGSPLLKKKALYTTENNKEGLLKTFIFAKLTNSRLIKNNLLLIIIKEKVRKINHNIKSAFAKLTLFKF